MTDTPHPKKETLMIIFRKSYLREKSGNFDVIKRAKFDHCR